MSSLRSLPLRLGAIAVLLAIDRASKLWAVIWLRPRGSIPVLPFFHLTYLENTGAAFGLGRDLNVFFTIVTVLMLGVLAYLHWAWRDKGSWILAGLALVGAGALGNLYDRLFYGFVVDFLDFRIWPVFNVADSCVTVGACCLAWGLRLEEKKAAIC